MSKKDSSETPSIFRLFSGILGVCGMVWASLAICSTLIRYGFENASELMRQLTDAYEFYRNYLLFFIAPIFEFFYEVFSDVFSIDIPIFSEWKDVATLVYLYVIAHASHALKSKSPNKIRAFLIRLIWGVFVGSSVCVFAALIPTNSAEGIGLASIACLLGVAGYRVGFAAQFAFDRMKKDGMPYWSEFVRKISGAWAFLIPSILIALYSEKLFSLPDFGMTRGAGFLLLFTVLLYSSAFHLILSYLSYRESMSKCGNFSIRDRFWSYVTSSIGTGNFLIGMYILGVIIFAVILIAESVIPYEKWLFSSK